MAEEENKKAPAAKKSTAATKKPAAPKAAEKKAEPKKEPATAKAPAKTASKTAPKSAAKKPAQKAKKAGVASVRVTQIGSPIGRQAYQRQTLIGLGLNKLHRTSELEDTPAVRGMINSIKHLVKVEEAA